MGKRLTELIQYPLVKKPSTIEAFKISQFFEIPLYPGYVFYWTALTLDEFKHLITKLMESGESIKNTNERASLLYDSEVKKALEKLGIIHSLSLEGHRIMIDDPDQLYILRELITKCIDDESRINGLLESSFVLDADPNNTKAYILDVISQLLNVSIKKNFLHQ